MRAKSNFLLYHPISDPPNRQILNNFLTEKSRREKKGPNEEMWKEVADGILIYFDKALPLILLYRQVCVCVCVFGGGII